MSVSGSEAAALAFLLHQHHLLSDAQGGDELLEICFVLIMMRILCCRPKERVFAHIPSSNSCCTSGHMLATFLEIVGFDDDSFSDMRWRKCVLWMAK